MDNIYLDFYIAASKPESLRKKDGPLGNGFKIFWNFFEGDYRYWFRYLTTLYMPILSMVIMMVAFGIVDLVTGLAGTELVISDYIYTSFVVVTLGSFGISEAGKAFSSKQ